jgi:hypothetical protein
VERSVALGEERRGEEVGWGEKGKEKGWMRPEGRGGEGRRNRGVSECSSSGEQS